MNPFVSIIILNYNGADFLENCLRSISLQDYDNYEVIIVDNASTDCSLAKAQKKFQDIRIICNETNLGYAEGNNVGVRHAKGEFVVLLNNDTIVNTGWLAGLVEAVQPSDVAVASSLVITEGIPPRYYEKNGSINFLGHNIMRCFENPSDIFFASGTSLIYKKNILGIPFDPDNFLYSEDVYLSLKARFMGFKVKHTNRSRLNHIGSATSAKQSNSLMTYYQERNRILNILLFFSGKTILKIFPFLLLNIIMKVLASVFSRKWALTGIIKAYIWFPLNLHTIIKKRKSLYCVQRVSEKEVISYMSGKLFNGENVFDKFINDISLAYCNLVKFKTFELMKK